MQISTIMVQDSFNLQKLRGNKGSALLFQTETHLNLAKNKAGGLNGAMSKAEGFPLVKSKAEGFPLVKSKAGGFHLVKSKA